MPRAEAGMVTASAGGGLVVLDSLGARPAWYTKIRPTQLLRFLLYYVQVTRRMDSSIVSAGIFI